MTLTTTANTWDTNVSKRPTLRAALSSKVKIYTIKVTYGAGDNYATNGNAISLKDGKINTYIAVLPIYNDKALHLRYDTTNEKILAYGDLNTATNAAPFTQLSNGATHVNSMVAEFLVIGI